jgi:outer membrane protein assembly factor BamB
VADTLESVKSQPAEWPWWRGPNLDGTSPDADPPVTWSETENIVWKTPVPGRGHSTPSIRGNLIFLQTADEDKKVQYVNCYRRDTGKELWSTSVHEGAFMEVNDKNTQASATPACDGERVYAAFPNGDAIRVTALDHAGNIVWQESAGSYKCTIGYASSPAIYKSLLIVSADGDARSFLTALHRGTGDIAWTVKRATGGSYVSPVVGSVAGRDQIFLAGGNQVISYDPLTGEQLWFCEGAAKVTASTMVFSADGVVASGGFPQREVLCVRADGTGDVSSSHVQWRKKRGIAYVPSPVIHDGKVYVLNDNGVVSCWTMETGEELWVKRLEGNFSASAAYAGGRFYVPNESGVTFVFRAEPEFEIVARNDLDDGGFASPVICGDRIYLRTVHYLYCIGGP